MRPKMFNGAFGVDVRNADGLIVVFDVNTGFWAFRMDGFNGWNGAERAGPQGAMEALSNVPLGRPGDWRARLARLLSRSVEVQPRRVIARARPERAGPFRFTQAEPAADAPEHLDGTAPARHKSRRGPAPAAALLGRQPGRQERVPFGRADGTTVFDVQFLAVETETGNAKLHGVRTRGARAIPIIGRGDPRSSDGYCQTNHESGDRCSRGTPTRLPGDSLAAPSVPPVPGGQPMRGFDYCRPRRADR